MSIRTDPTRLSGVDFWRRIDCKGDTVSHPKIGNKPVLEDGAMRFYLKTGSG
jgi:hypothetical protein